MITRLCILVFIILMFYESNSLIIKSSSKIISKIANEINFKDTSILIDGKKIKKKNSYIIPLYLFKLQYNNVCVPLKFVVPNQSPWPKEYWGMNLGDKVNRLRQLYKNDKLNTEEIDILNKLGLVWKVSDEKFNKFYNSLKIYNQIYNNCNIPVRFVFNQSIHNIPDNIHEYKLGFLCHRVIKGYLFNSSIYHDQLRPFKISLNVQRNKRKISSLCRQLNTFASSKDIIDKYIHLIESNESIYFINKLLHIYLNNKSNISRQYFIDLTSFDNLSN